MGRRWDYIKKILTGLLILSGLTVSLYSQDKPISGVINVYKRVVAIGPGLDNVTLNNADSIAPGDTVLLIQMQGVKIVTTQDGYGLGVQDTIGKPGGYEFLLVQSVVAGTKVIFRNNILNTFDIKGNVQLIRVPSYNSAIVTGRLTAKSWDNIEKTGGVLAMILGRKLKLDAEIDVSGKGFSGGKDTIGIGECVMVNPTVNNHDSYPRTWLNAGYKGEGIASHDEFGNLLEPLHMKGRGINFTGGGGGNGKYSGGGGGANRGVGGDGIYEKNLGTGKCSDPQPGAYGATSVKVPIISDGVFFGGGGGASTHASGSTGSSGGNGGGIIIIVADTLSGNSKSIYAEGATAGDALADAGAGGGGAGGSVVLSFQSFSDVATDSLHISVTGGNGGINPDGFGTGGGGGGGLIWVSNANIPSKVPVKMNFGIPGPLNPSDGIGELKYSFRPVLNGFLFNSIRSGVTGNQVDSICSNVTFGLITGTFPVGGKPDYTFLWEYSTTSESADYTPAPGINNQQNYSPGILIQTTWFRRVITDGSIPVITDISKPVKIIVQQYIRNNSIITDPDTICFNGDPQLLKQDEPDLVVPTTKYLKYIWQVSTDDGSTWGTEVDTVNKEYDPPAGLTQDSWYRRKVKSGRCIDQTAVIKIKVLPEISNNTILQQYDTICFGQNTNLTTVAGPSGGNSIYSYLWEYSTTGSVNSWNPVPGETNQTFDPDASAFLTEGNHYYRRKVFSGEQDACKDSGNIALRKVWPVITNNTIAEDQTICSASAPLALYGSNPEDGAGPGSYSYLWEERTNGTSWRSATGVNNLISGTYLPPPLADTTFYRRIVNSGVFNSAPVCSNTSLSIRINVHKPIINNISLLSGGFPDTTICNGNIPHTLTGTVAEGGISIPGSYSYQWVFSTDNSTWTLVPSEGTDTFYSPPGLTTTSEPTVYSYKRLVTSGACINISSTTTITVNVLPSISNNIISASQTAICQNTEPGLITGLSLSGGSGAYSYFWEQSPDSGANWASATGVNNLSSYQPPVLINSMRYKRTVRSGLADCCSSISNGVDIGINPLPVSPYAGPDTTIFSMEKIYHMKADPVFPGETGLWTVLEPVSGIIEDISANETEVRNLSTGENSFIWTVSKGPCKLEDLVTVTLVEDFIPRGFSPNDDSWNNTFIIEGLNLPDQVVEMQVLNGAGREVFSTNNIDGNAWTDWDGKNSKGLDLPEGTYYYLLKITSKRNGQVFRKSGFIVLKRY